MAKGNDGNYFQHGIEVAVATQLAALDDDNRLRVALAHGMAPFEVCDPPRNGQARGRLEATLQMAQQPAQPNEYPLVGAYRATHANLDHYPNSAELLRVAIGQGLLYGGITEVNPAKCKALHAAWANSHVHVKNASWRQELVDGGILCPNGPHAPWLVTVDPMTYRVEGAVDDEYLYQADLGLLSEGLTAYIDDGQPGTAAIFVYAVRPEIRPLFWQFAQDLADNTNGHLMGLWIGHQGGNRNLGALVSWGFQPDLGQFPEGVRIGDE